MIYSVCMDSVFGSENMEKNISKVREAGFSAFEFWLWENRNLDAIRSAADENGLQIACCCSKMITLVEPELRKEFIAGLRESIQAAKKLNCKSLILQTGNDSGKPRAFQRESMVTVLKESAEIVQAEGITLLVEPLNLKVDHMGYFLWKSDEAYEIIDEIGSESVKILFDIYHQQISEGDLIQNIRAGGSRIGHFHAAGNPGRHELSPGEINYPAVIKAICETGYDKFFGLEYFPEKEPVESLRAELKKLPVL